MLWEHKFDVFVVLLHDSIVQLRSVLEEEVFVLPLPPVENEPIIQIIDKFPDVGCQRFDDELRAARGAIGNIFWIAETFHHLHQPGIMLRHRLILPHDLPVDFLKIVFSRSRHLDKSCSSSSKALNR